MSDGKVKPLCAAEELIQRLGYELMHDGQVKPGYPTQGSNGRYFTRTYRLGNEEAIFRYDQRDGGKRCVYFDIVLRDSYGVRRERQRMVMRT
jgi:hypothetical protein